MKRLLTYLSLTLVILIKATAVYAGQTIAEADGYWIVGTNSSGTWSDDKQYQLTDDNGTLTVTFANPYKTSGIRGSFVIATSRAFDDGSNTVNKDKWDKVIRPWDNYKTATSGDCGEFGGYNNFSPNLDAYDNIKVTIVRSSGTFTFEGVNNTTTATLTIGGYDITGTNSGSNYNFSIPAERYTAGSTLTFTLKTETSGTATYYTGNFTGTHTGQAFTYGTSSSSATMKYSVPSEATGAITVSLRTGSSQVYFAYQTSGGGGTSTGYYLVGDLNCFGRPYTDTSWNTSDWTSNGAVNKVMQFHANSDGTTYSLRIPASRPSSDDSTWDKPVNEKGTGTWKFVIAPEAAFSGTEYSGDLFSVSNWNNWSSLELNWSQVLRPQNNSSLNNADIASGTMAVMGGDNCWTVNNNGGSYTITINPSAGTFSVTNDNTTHVMYVITKQDGHWRNSYLTDVASDQNTAYNHRHGDNASMNELSEFPNLDGETVYIAHNWHEQGNNKNFTTNQHLNIFGAWNDNGDLAPVTWIKAKSGATAKSIFPTKGNYSTNIDPTTGRTDGVDGASQYSTVISSGNDPSTGNITGKTGDAALIDPDATLSPGTTTWDSYTLNDPKTLTVTLYNDATGYKYSYGAGSTPNISGTDTAFGNLSYDGTNVKLGNDVVASGNTVTIRIQGTKDASEGAIHNYTYTFNQRVVTTIDFTPKGGLFINSAKITVNGGTAPYTYTVKDANDASGKVLSTGNFVLDENYPDGNYRISTPGYLTVTDKDGNSATSNVPFDFTYSTSENYMNYNNNATGSKIIQTGGGQGALNVFINKNDDLNTLWLYAYNKTLDTYIKGQGETDQDKIDRQVRLTDAFPGNDMTKAPTITIDGIKYVHFTIPKGNLRDGDNVAIIVSQGTTDKQNWYTQTTDEGIEIEQTSNPAYIYNIKNSPSGTPSSGADNAKGTNTLLRMDEEGKRTIFFTKPSDWTAPIYCHSWIPGSTETAWKATNEKMTVYDENNNIYTYTVPNGMTKLMFVDKNNNKTSEPVYNGGRKHYTLDGKTLKVADASYDANLTELTTFLNTPPTTTVVTQRYPNGEDYWRAAPGDLSIKLDPKWGITDGLAESSTRDWAGNVPKVVYTNQMPLTQTIQGLNAGNTYTVQAIVGGLGEGKKTVTLTLEGAETVTKTINLRSGGSESSADLSRQGSEITMTGRVEYIEPLKFEGMNKYDVTKAGGWAKVEAKVKASQAGWLTISLKGDESFDLSQVTLLEDANTDHGFRTTASATALSTGDSEDTHTFDYRARDINRGWKKNNAYSFFDRGKNRNAVIFANERTVIAMNSDLLANDQQNAELKAVDRRHPFNVVGSDEDDTKIGTAKALYLTDMGYGGDDKNPVDYKIGDPKWETYNSTNYRKSGYTFKPYLSFYAEDVILDRTPGVAEKKQTTIMLPFGISVEEMKEYYGKNLRVWNYESYDTNKKTITFNEVTGNLTANTPYILTGANGMLDSRGKGKAKKTVAQVVNTIHHTASNHEGFTGTYEYKVIERSAEGETRYGYNPTTGKFQIAAATGASLKPFRAYFTLPVVFDQTTSARELTVIFDDVITGISESVQVNVEPTNVYTLGGVLVARNGDLSRLPKGVYIVNGKKVIK